MKMIENVDLRTDYEKNREAYYREIGEHYKELIKMPFASPTRVFRYLAKEYNTTLLTIRINLIKLGYYTPNGKGRTEGGK